MAGISFAQSAEGLAGLSDGPVEEICLNAPGIMSHTANKIRGTRPVHVARIALAGLVLGGAVEGSLATDNVSASSNVHYSGTIEALGDSVAAGFGLPWSPNASAEDQACGRSPQAYPAIVASALGVRLGKNVACSGAVVNNLTAPQIRDGVSIQPQLDAAFASGVPKLLTLTIGANDVNFSKVLGECFSSSSCNTKANTKEVNSSLVTLKSNLRNALHSIRLRPGRAPKTVVTGYYRPVSNDCIRPDGISKGEVTWLNERTGVFNKTLKDTAREFSFAKFAPVSFKDHDICSNQPWVYGILYDARLHPTARGQRAIARAVLQTLEE